MKNWIFRLLAIIFISFILSITNFKINDNAFNVMFTIIGIFFSFSISQIMSFSFVDVENTEYVEKRKKNLTRIRKIFILLFAISTALYLLPDSFKTMNNLFNIFFFIYNFILLSNLKSDIDEDIRKEQFKINHK